MDNTRGCQFSFTKNQTWIREAAESIYRVVGSYAPFHACMNIERYINQVI